MLRQADGRLWSWEGCGDSWGCCHGSCTHVWNYAQAMPHLFPALERTLRETEFRVSQDERGHQTFRAALPIRPAVHDFHAAADGQLGGIMKVYREWRISGDTEWLRSLWPSVKTSLDYCIDTWDPRHTGASSRSRTTTRTTSSSGARTGCARASTSARCRRRRSWARRSATTVPAYAELLEKGRRRMETDLWNGEYFVQKVQWKDLRAGNPPGYEEHGRRVLAGSGRALLDKEGPKYQYGDGLPLRRRARRVDGRGVRRRRGPRPRQGRAATCARSIATT